VHHQDFAAYREARALPPVTIVVEGMTQAQMDAINKAVREAAEDKQRFDRTLLTPVGPMSWADLHAIMDRAKEKEKPE
jgi:hypothetical protein